MRPRRLLLLGYVAVIGILLASGVIIAFRTRTAMRTAISQDAQTLAGSLIDEIDAAVWHRVQTMLTFAGTSAELHDALRRSNAERAKLGSIAVINEEIDALDDAWDPRAAPTAEMRAVLDSPTSQLLARTMAFHEQSAGSSVFAEIFVTDRYGANVGQTGITSDFRQDDEPWWTAAWNTGLWAAEDVSYDESAKVHSVDIGVRVEDASGARLGVLKAVLNVRLLREIIDGFGAHGHLEGASVELIDSHGHLIHRQGGTAFGEDMSGREAVRRLLDGETGAVIEQIEDEEMLSVLVRSRAPDGHPGTGWSLILNQRTASVYAPLHALTRWMTSVGVMAALLAAFVGYLTAAAFARVTARLELASQALRRSEAAIRAIVTNVPDGVITSDVDGRIESMNPAAEQMFGRTAAETIGKNVTTLMPQPYASEHAGYIERFLTTGEARAIGNVREVEGVHADGTTFPIDLSIGQIVEGEQLRFVGIVRDASERHEAQRVLEQAKEVAESASTAKSQFLANMSHELRTPLNAVIGYAEMVGEELEERGDDQLVSDVGRIRTAGFNLLGLIDDILDLSKIEAGRMELFEEDVDLGSALSDIADTVRPLVKTNQNELVFDAAHDLGVVHTDVTKMRQILLNLLSNAAKFTSSGRIEFHAQRVSGAPHDWLVLRVADDGIGMSTEQIEGVWEAFAQADASTTRKYGGTGLGLTITKRFTEMLGGTIDLESKEGAGTTFTVRLPAKPSLAEVAIEPLAAPIGAAHRRGDAVLVIDDDSAARDLVRRHLAGEGYDVIEAGDGHEGLRLAREVVPAVIILDVMMPGMDGWAVLAGLRGEPELAKIPVVMLTMAQERSLGIALGVDAYLTKPIDRPTLREVLTPFCIDRAGHRILVAEDDDATRDMLCRALRSDGWTVLEAENGEIALAALRDEGADVAIIDLMMPVLDGFGLIRAIREDEDLRELPVIVVTAKDITPEDAADLEGAVQQVLQKARFGREQMLVEVARQVRHAVGRRPGGESGTPS